MKKTGALCLSIISLLVLMACQFNQGQAMKALQNDYRRMAQKILPVAVEVKTKSAAQEDDTPWPFFFPGPEDETPAPERQRSGLGSGVIVRQLGQTFFVVTNQHVINQAETIIITLPDGEEVEAELVGVDERKDIAIVSFISEKDLPTAVLGDSDLLQVGDVVMAAGSPYGLTSTLTAGIVSAVERRGGPGNNINDFIQTDAAINQGNSGGALVNIKGEVVGINTWITSPSGGNIGLGFSIPINNIKRTISSLITDGVPRYGWLGVSLSYVDEALASGLGRETQEGAFVSQVFHSSPADKGGLLPGDIILELNQEKIEDWDELVFLVGELEPGSRAEFRLWRQGEFLTRTALIDDRGDDKALAALTAVIWPGFTIAVTEEKELMVDQVYPKTQAQRAALQGGDIIKSINDIPITSIAQLYRIMNQRRSEPLMISIVRGDDEREIELKALGVKDE